MTAEEKAKAYDEAVKKVKNLENTTIIEERLIDYIFPGLNENDDERIRKKIINFIKNALHSGGGVIVSEDEEKSMLDYLERLKESKPAEEDNELLLDAIGMIENRGGWMSQAEQQRRNDVIRYLKGFRPKKNMDDIVGRLQNIVAILSQSTFKHEVSELREIIEELK